MVFSSSRPTLDVPRGNAVAEIWKSPHIKPSAPAYTDAKTGDSITFGQAKDGSLRLAKVLQTEFGIGPKSVVVLALNNYYLTPLLHHAVLLLGAIVSPANVAYTAFEFSHQVKTVEPKLVIADESVVATVVEGVEQAKVNTLVIDYGDIKKTILKCVSDPNLAPADVAAVDGDQPAYYCFSSGTSGLPKCVITTHTNIAVNMLQLVDADGGLCLPGVPVGAILPLSHIFGLQVYIWASGYYGCNTVVFRKFVLEDVLEGIVKYKIVCLAVVPPLVLALAKSPLVDRYPITQTLKFAVSGAAPLSLSLLQEAEKRLPGLQIVQAYGQTESSPLSLGLIGSNLHTYDKSSAGWLVANTQARLVDPDTLEDVKDGERGELWIKGPQVMAGYLNNPTANAETLVDGWLRSGDVAVRSPDGQFSIVDRIKELIKSKGHQVAPAELEGILLSYPGVSDAAVIGVFDEAKSSELPRAYLVLQDSHDIFEIIKKFNKQVSVHKRLWGGVVVLDAIPKSPSGKILRRILRDSAATDKVIVVDSKL